MFKYLIALAIALPMAGANAQVYKCKGVDGKTQFSDTACKAGNKTEVVPDRAPVTEQQRYEARQRAARLREESLARDEHEANFRAARQTEQRREQIEAAQKEADAKVVSNETEAIANCVRDIERRGASASVKAEMIAACRTAGLVQRSTGMTGESVSNCVKNVERTSASEKEKARQLATCHGADVQPEPPAQKRKPTLIMSCDSGGCWDDVGHRYNGAPGGMMFRGDGKACQQTGNMLQCN